MGAARPGCNVCRKGLTVYTYQGFAGAFDLATAQALADAAFPDPAFTGGGGADGQEAYTYYANMAASQRAAYVNSLMASSMTATPSPVSATPTPALAPAPLTRQPVNPTAPRPLTPPSMIPAATLLTPQTSVPGPVEIDPASAGGATYVPEGHASPAAPPQKSGIGWLAAGAALLALMG